jgi:hypothetical protein
MPNLKINKSMWRFGYIRDGIGNTGGDAERQRLFQ